MSPSHTHTLKAVMGFELSVLLTETIITKVIKSYESFSSEYSAMPVVV